MHILTFGLFPTFSLRVLTISLSALSVICFDFMMGFIVDIFSNGETDKFMPIILASIFLIILLFVTECLDGYVMSSYIKNTVNYLRCDIFTKILNTPADIVAVISFDAPVELTALTSSFVSVDWLGFAGVIDFTLKLSNPSATSTL